jgi:foldase protein PrsA
VKASLFIFLLCASFLLSGITQCQSHQETKSYPVLVVGEASYNLDDFSKDLAFRLAQQDLLSAKNPSVIQVLKNRLLSDFILEHLILEDLKEQNLSVTEEELLKALQEIKAPYGENLNFQEELLKANISETSFNKTVSNELRLKKFFSLLKKDLEPPSNQDCLDFYNRNKGEYYLPQRIYLRQIVVKEEHQARELLDFLNKKTRSFEFLAENFSLGPESVNQGLVGWVEENQISLFEPAFPLKPGQVSSIEKSSFGFHLFKVEKKEPKKQLEFNEVKDKITTILMAEQEQGLFLKWLDERLRKTKIQKDDALLKALVIETKGE